MLRIIIRYIKRTLACLLFLLAAYFLSAITLSLISTAPEDLHDVKRKAIFISTNGVHLDIIIPRKFLAKKWQQDLEIPELAKYMSFGWGDKAFYTTTPTWSDLKLRTAIRAIFLNTKPALRATAFYRRYDSWNKLNLDEVQLELLLNYIEQSFERNQENSLVEIEVPGYTAYDKFYEATGNFNGIQTCNNWVNKGLKEAKVKTSVWSPFDYGVLYHIGKGRVPKHERL